MLQSDIAIIGSGMAGYFLAQQLRELNDTAKITVITANDGRFYPKPMLSTALYHKKTPDTITTATAEEMSAKYGIEVITHAQVSQVLTRDHLIQCNDKTVQYKKLVFATGSKAIMIPGVVPVSGFLSVNSMEDYEQLLSQLDDNKRILIIGSGLVGVEFAHDLLAAGYDVSMVSQVPNALLGLVPDNIGDLCRDHLISMGLNWIEDRGVRGVCKKRDQVVVQFSDREDAEYDLVLSAVGITPNTELAKQTNLEVNKGIITDEFGRTSQDDVFALGDCAEIYGLNLTYVAPIKQQSQAVAKTILGQQTPIQYPAMPVVVKMPTFPLTLVPVREVEIKGQWQSVENDLEKGVISAFYDQDQLKGFALAGQATKKRNEWLQKMPPSIIT